MREDVACAMRVPSMTAGGMLHTAAALTARFPATLAAMRDGQLSARYARRLDDATVGLPDKARREVEQTVLARAGQQTLAQFAAAVRRAVLGADPRTAETRHRDAVEQRRVIFTPQDDGTSEVWAVLPAEQAAALQARIQAIADQWKGQDERTADQRRADALSSLATATATATGTDPAGAGAGLKPTVNVTVARKPMLELMSSSGLSASDAT